GASAANSTVTANPASVPADGATASTITVTLEDANHNPVSGKAASLAAGGGSSLIATVNGPTNAACQATFTVKDTLAEAVTYSATDSTDSVSISQTATVTFTAVSAYGAQIQQPVNTDGSSVFSANRGVVPVKFTLTSGGVSTCSLPTATIALFRVSGNVDQPVSESVYSMTADNGSYFRISGCQYVYNLAAGALRARTWFKL